MTGMLSTAGLASAREYVAAHARPLERARFTHLVDGGSFDRVAEELAAFRNADGGFGNALESDCRAPESSALGALTALDILRDHGAPGDHPLVAEACGWLLDNVTEDAQARLVWPFLPPTAQASPHAPWWDQSEPGMLARTFNGYVANPGVALTAHLWRHEAAAAGSVPREVLERLTAQAMAVAQEGVSAQEVNAHDALAHFGGEEAVPGEARDVVIGYLARVLPERVMRTPQDYAGYGIHPLWVAPDPGHPLAEVLAERITQGLDQVIGAQQPDGSWQPFWDWGGWHPEIWEVAAREWSGSLVIRNIATLMAYGRVAPVRRGP